MQSSFLLREMCPIPFSDSSVDSVGLHSGFTRNLSSKMPNPSWKMLCCLFLKISPSLETLKHVFLLPFILSIYKRRILNSSTKTVVPLILFYGWNHRSWGPRKTHVCQQSLKLILKYGLTTKTIPLSGILWILPLQESQSPALNDSQLRHENWQQRKYPRSTGWYSWQPDGIRTAAKDNTEPGQAAWAPAWKFGECPQVPTPRSFMCDNRPLLSSLALPAWNSHLKIYSGPCLPLRRCWEPTRMPQPEIGNRCTGEPE